MLWPEVGFCILYFSVLEKQNQWVWEVDGEREGLILIGSQDNKNGKS